MRAYRRPILALVAGLMMIVCWAIPRSGPMVLAEEGDPVTVTLRRGLSAAWDTTIDIANPGANYGSGALRMKQGGGLRCLLWFDVSSIPADAVIDAAELRVTPIYQYPAGCSLTVRAYALLRPWEEGTATWTWPWAAPGADAVGYDREGAPVASATLSAVNTKASFSVRDLVQGWVSGLRRNDGLILVGDSGGCYLNLASGETASSRPELVVTYHLEPAGATVTPGPSPTPGPRTVISSTSYDACLQVSGKTGPQSAEVLLVWEGAAEEARLTLRFSGNEVATHPVYLNGHRVGTLPATNWDGLCAGGTVAEWPVDPAWLAPGRNTITISNEDAPGDDWSARNIRLEVTGDVRASRVFAVDYTTGGTYSPQTAWVQLPMDYDEDPTPRPLLVVCHWWGASGQAALFSYAEEANRRGWILAAPDLGNAAAAQWRYTPSLDVQHDIMDLVAYMKAYYRTNERRVYLTGVSLGGAFAAVTGAKNPDVFAAIAIDKAPSEFDRWYYESLADPQQRFRAERIAQEIGADPAANPFAYQSRSAVPLARNLRQVPVAMTYPLSDTVVPPHHTTNLYDALVRWGAGSVQIASYPGGHDSSASVRDALDFLSRYTLQKDPDDLSLITDEGKRYYWLSLQKATTTCWAEVSARADAAEGRVTLDTVLTDTVTIGVDLARIGLSPWLDYAVADTDLGTGETVTTTVSPLGDLLLVRPGQGRHHLTIDQVTPATPTANPSNTPSAAPTITPTPTATLTGTPEPTATCTEEPTATATPSASPTATASATALPTATVTATASPSPSPTATAGSAGKPSRIALPLILRAQAATGLRIQVGRLTSHSGTGFAAASTLPGLHLLPPAFMAIAFLQSR